MRRKFSSRAWADSGRSRAGPRRRARCRPCRGSGPDAGSLRLAVDPDRPLAVRGRVVDALDQVPGEARGRRPRARPRPTSASWCGAGGSRRTRRRRREPRSPSACRGPRPSPRPGPRPACGSSPSRSRWGRSLRSGRTGRAAGWPAAPASRSRARAVHPHLAAARPQHRARVVAAPLAVPHHPEGLAERPDLGPRRAQHHLVAEDADVAPALAQSDRRGVAASVREEAAGRAGRSPARATGSERSHRPTVVLSSRLGAMDQLIQIVGALLILAAFAAVQFERMRPDSRLYLALNLVGSVILAVLAGAESQWGFLLLEGVWAIVSAWGLARPCTDPSRGGLVVFSAAPMRQPAALKKLAEPLPEGSEPRAARRAGSSRARGRPQPRQPSRSRSPPAARPRRRAGWRCP